MPLASAQWYVFLHGVLGVKSSFSKILSKDSHWRHSNTWCIYKDSSDKVDD